MSRTEIDNKIWDLQKICNLYDSENNDFSGKWILYAIARYINTGRASAEWIKLFLNLTNKKIEHFVKAKINQKLSDDETIKRFNKLIKF